MLRAGAKAALGHCLVLEEEEILGKSGVDGEDKGDGDDVQDGGKLEPAWPRHAHNDRHTYSTC